MTGLSRARRDLVDLVLGASFRAERHGARLLAEQLPSECPVEASAQAEASWAALVAAQAGYRERGAADPWGFWSLVRAFHAELAKGPLSFEEMDDILCALTDGPSRSCSDAELEAHLEAWAHKDLHENDWIGPEYYWHQRFVRGLSRASAHRAMVRERAKQRDRRMVEKIREYGITDWHPTWASTPISERHRLIRLAGRPDLITLEPEAS